MVVRHDDMDFRLETQQYIDIHEKFIQNGLTETAVVQLTTFGRIFNFGVKADLLEYMRTAPNWDIQFHCWEHKSYAKMDYDEIVKEVSASLYWMGAFFKKLPTVWYPAYNEVSSDMERAAKLFNLRIDNVDVGIKEFVESSAKSKPTYHAVHFHGWATHEMKYFDQMLALVKEYESR